MRLVASSERSGSVVGMVAFAVMKRSRRCSCRFSSAKVSVIAINRRRSIHGCSGSPSIPSCPTSWIKPALTFLIRASSSSASAATRACSSVMRSVIDPAMRRANASTSGPTCKPDRGSDRPWRYALPLDRFFPKFERGPVLLRALRRLASICFWLVNVALLFCLLRFVLQNTV